MKQPDPYPNPEQSLGERHTPELFSTFRICKAAAKEILLTTEEEMNSRPGPARHPQPCHKFKQVPGAQVSSLHHCSTQLCLRAQTAKLAPGLVLESEARHGQISIWQWWLCFCSRHDTIVPAKDRISMSSTWVSPASEKLMELQQRPYTQS